jgi:hypothetical protein
LKIILQEMKFSIIFGIIFSGSLDCCIESFERSFRIPQCRTK